MFADVSGLSVFLYGLASFVSPCVLPLLPSYILLLSGNAGEEGESRRWYTVLTGCMFVLGFSIIFIAMGATAGSIGQLLTDYRKQLTFICGIVLIVFGVIQTASLLIPALQKERRTDFSRFLTGRKGVFFPVLCVLAGMGFAFGWTPCIGPYLTSSLMLAARSQTMWRGIFLLALYSLGLGLPFILAAIFVNLLQRFLPALRKAMPVIQRLTGIALILVGIFMITDAFGFLARLGA